MFRRRRDAVTGAKWSNEVAAWFGGGDKELFESGEAASATVDAKVSPVISRSRFWLWSW